jgi:hypothetical protein
LPTLCVSAHGAGVWVAEVGERARGLR